MVKHEFKDTRISLLPKLVVIVTSVDQQNRVGATTIAWSGILSSRPPAIGVSFLPDSFTRSCIIASREFVINVPDENLVEETNYLGSVSGPWEEKFAGMLSTLGRGLSLSPSRMIRSPLIEECYLNFECRSLQSIQIGLYDCFIGEILTMHCHENVFKNDHPRGNIDHGQVHPIFCFGDEYWGLAKKIGVSTENKKHPHGLQH